MVLALLDQLQIFWQLYLIELLELLTGLWLLEALDISKALRSLRSWAFDIFNAFGFSMLVFFPNSSLMEFRSDIWPYFFFSQ